MRFSLINPAWNFEGSIYFGCREPHLPLEYGYSRALLQHAGHDVQLVDAQFDGLSHSQVYERVAAFRPDFSVVTTAPSYLFWRCAPPELRIPQEMVETLRPAGGKIVQQIGVDAPEITARFSDPAGNIIGIYQQPAPKG